MSLLRNAFRSSVSLRCVKSPNRAFSSLLLRSFSTEAEHPPKAPAAEAAAEKPAQDSTTGISFPQHASGVVYGRLSGISSSTLKTDILSLLGGCKLTPQDVRVDYDSLFKPAVMVIQFPSRRAYDTALTVCRNEQIKINGKIERIHQLEKADPRLWDALRPYDGKTVCIKGIPQNAVPDDLERFLSGCEYNATQMFYRNIGSRKPTRVALVEFPSQVQAMNAFVRKNGGFLLNTKVSVQVLQ